MFSIKEARIKIGLSQSKLSELSGVDQGRISAHELEKKLLTSNELKKINNLINKIDEKKISQIKKKRYSLIDDGLSVIQSRKRRGYKKTNRNEEYIKTLSQIEKDFNRKLTAKSPRALSFFAGCGGLCYGMKAAGFDIVGTNELVDSYKEIYKKNFKNANFLPNDIREIKKIDLAGFHDIDMMLGGPPCQGFSLAGKRSSDDERNNLFKNYLKIAATINPKIIIMENVSLLTSMKDTDGTLVKDNIMKTFETYGYKSQFFDLNAMDYGVPQHRKRVFFIGLREDVMGNPSVPDPLYSYSDNLFDALNIPFSFGDAVSDLDFIESGEVDEKDNYHSAVTHPEHVLRWLIDVPEGMSAHDNKDEGLRPPSGYNTTYKRQVWNQPSATVGTTFSMISGCRNVHPIATRSLTIREALRLQSFPDSFKLCGKLGDMRTTIGNAVPPLLSYNLGKHIIKNYIL